MGSCSETSRGTRPPVAARPSCVRCGSSRAYGADTLLRAVISLEATTSCGVRGLLVTSVADVAGLYNIDAIIPTAVRLGPPPYLSSQ
jgi:hypothetical protein